MAERTLTPDSLDLTTADIRDFGYAIVQTRTERVPPHTAATSAANRTVAAGPPRSSPSPSPRSPAKEPT